MYQTRAKLTKKIPIERKGTRYIARSLVDLENSVPVVVAVRNMLNLATTAKEVREMIKQKLLKLNGKEIKDYRDSIRLFNVFEAGESYVLTFTANGKFTFEKTKDKERICKVIDKKILKGNKTQLNLHDGSNVLSEDRKINTQDTVYLDFSGKITKHVPLEKTKNCFIIAGKYIGNKGKIISVEGSKAKIQLKDKETVLERQQVVAL
ncbi:MAG: hypothetical protein KJ600_04370 [Nanoarchaeota archaeon]|nr:hypothetical protein [Nanoarchaeota archaeon]MBU1103763.1 hypothetical protein [Nanoarchaeota archaeon]